MDAWLVTLKWSLSVNDIIKQNAWQKILDRADIYRVDYIVLSERHEIEFQNVPNATECHFMYELRSTLNKLRGSGYLDQGTITKTR